MILFTVKSVKILNIHRITKNLLAVSIFLTFALVPSSGQQGNIVSPHYLLPEFTKGTVLMKAGVPRELKMNYNIITEEMIFEYPGKYLALTNIEAIDTVFILDRKFIPSGKVFYEVLLNNKIPLFARYTCSLTPPGKPSGYGGTSQTSAVTVIDQLFSSGMAYNLKLPDDYTVVPSTDYILFINDEIVRIYNIKQVIKAFPEKEAQIKEYNKNMKVDFKNKEEVISLIRFCNK